ncbi:2,3-bisphosphoglycerate-independent phosphoglycerate mutase [Halobacteriales archaeon QS_1_68_20]|nr:MAG: 2,3-bisphosphoglycerate-independent phosphoglycerate mutase [Halobacteriales archaeon QS_1_68_20]
MDVALVILDGWGLGPTDDPDHRNAVETAETPNFDRYADAGAYGTLEVSGRAVGLPDAQMGNSEVGHLNVGAGRVVYQEYTRINDSITASDLDTLGDLEASGAGNVPDEPFDENPALLAAFEHAREHDGRVHFMGLVSDGGVHSDYEHLFALIEMADDLGVDAVTHAFTDGRDTDPESGAGYLRDLEAVVDRYGTGEVATVSGRYYAMDRDRNWDRTRRAYDVITRRVVSNQNPENSDDAMVNRQAEFEAPSAVESSYDRGTTDEFAEPTLVSGEPALEDGDGVVFFNFRADRARQLTRMLADLPPEDDSVAESGTTWPDPPEVTVTTMTEYDRTFDLPVAFEPHQPGDVLGEVLADVGYSQLRIAESEKYAHVTYFLNGGREVEFDGEIRRIVESPDVPTYDQQPEMSAPEVTDTAIECIEDRDPDVMVLNYANPDMVGHTGDYEAATTAVEAVDEQLGRLVDACQEAGAHVLLTADHGNADDMGTEEDPHTAHTYNDVPLVYLAPDGTDGGNRIRGGGRLADVAPTMLALLGIDEPEAMTGEELLT